MSTADVFLENKHTRKIKCWQCFLPIRKKKVNPPPFCSQLMHPVSPGDQAECCAQAHLPLLREDFQMFRSSRCSGMFPPDEDVSSELVSCSGSQLMAWAQGTLLLPDTDCQGPSPCHSSLASTGMGTAFKKRGKKGDGKESLGSALIC